MALRESPIRRKPSGRPPWLIPLLIGVAILVVVGIVYGISVLVRGPSSSTDEPAAATASPTCTVVPQTLAESLPKPEKVALNVYNGTQTSGLAGKTAKAFKKSGFSVVNVGNEPDGKEVTGIGEIRFGPKGKAQADLVLIYVPGATLVPVDRKGKAVDVVIGDAFPGLASQESVDAALAGLDPNATSTCASTSASAAP
jgi:hypothetical protein